MTTTTPTNTDRLHLRPAYQAQALTLRQAGRSYRQIAETLGFDNANAAQHAVYYGAQRAGVEVPRTRRGARSSAVPRAARQFGVEIEVVGINGSRAAQAIADAGVPCTFVGYNHTTPRAGHWKVVTDASVHGGCEIVSPPMSGPDAFAALDTVMAALRDAGARIDRQCGIHVHHEVIDLSGEECARLVEFYATHQAAMNSLVAPSRRNCGWAAPMSPAVVADFARRFRAVTATTASAKRAEAQRNGIGGRPGSRYHAVNVHAFGNYGTIEFRQHQGSLNATKVAAWVRLGQAMIEAVREGDTITTAGFLADLAAAGRLGETDAEYLTRRQASLA